MWARIAVVLRQMKEGSKSTLLKSAIWSPFVSKTEH